jgi:hypothetical protein
MAIGNCFAANYSIGAAKRRMVVEKKNDERRKENAQWQ